MSVLLYQFTSVTNVHLLLFIRVVPTSFTKITRPKRVVFTHSLFAPSLAEGRHLVPRAEDAYAPWHGCYHCVGESIHED